MTNNGNWPFLDRLNNDEFYNLLPHLSLEHTFLTQIFLLKKKWIRMLDANFQTLKVFCGSCEEQMGFEDIRNHLHLTNHLKSLRSNVKQFYHPFYTYGKADTRLARGEHVSQECLEMALREVNIQTKSFKKDYILAKQFADMVHCEIQKSKEDRFLQLSLNMKVENPEQMFVMVCLPINDISKLHFCSAGGKWNCVFGYKYLTENANFCCNICNINCSGIERLNSHLDSFRHKLRQLELPTLRHEANSQINKNVCLYFGNQFSYSVKKDAEKYFGMGKDAEFNCKSSSQYPKLSKEMEKKVKSLSEYVSKIFTQSAVNRNVIDQSDKSDYSEYLGHLGVEYVLRILKNDYDQDAKYECGLCEFLGDENKMQRHILNYEHKKKYLDLHYPDTVKKYESDLGHMRYMNFRAVISEIVDKVATEIEKHHGRSLPYTVSFQDYKNRRPELIAAVYSLLHASQNRGPSFSRVLSKDDLQTLKNSAAELVENKSYKNINYVIFITPPKDKVYLNQLSHDPVIRLREYNAKMEKKTITGRSSHSITPTKSNLNSRNENNRSRSRSPISFESPIQQSIWDIYRREIATAAKEIENDYAGYRKNPESHPLYEEEWNNFWQHRKRELEIHGINHRTYDFQPEWVHYFKQRIEALFGDALHKSQLYVRRKLEIPIDAEEDSQRSHHLYELTKNKRINRIEESDDYRRFNKYHSSFDNKEGPVHEKSTSENKSGNKITSLPTNEIIIRDNHSNIVHVLRLMTALEEHLGILGGKIMNLLSNALQMEKHFRGNIVDFEANILTTTNCQLLETAVEKLKGILFAGLLDDSKISSFNRVIQYTTSLLKYAEKMGWRQDTIPLVSAMHCRDGKKVTEGDTDTVRNKEGELYKRSNKKPLSDTLMDLISTTQTNKSTINASDEFRSISANCPPPPDIKCVNLNPDLSSVYKGQQSLNSGLASFDTKLSLDAPNQIQVKSLDHTVFGRPNRDRYNVANILNNNSFKNNNETRTNLKALINNESNIEGSMNNNNGSSLQFRNSQFIPSLFQNNAMCYGGGGANRNQNWSRWKTN